MLLIIKWDWMQSSSTSWNLFLEGLAKRLLAHARKFFDIKSQRSSDPLFDLLDGRQGKNINAHANIDRWTLSRIPEEFAYRAQAAISHGCKAIKFVPFCVNALPVIEAMEQPVAEAPLFEEIIHKGHHLIDGTCNVCDQPGSGVALNTGNPAPRKIGSFYLRL